MKYVLFTAGLAGLTGVALGAFGAHALHQTLASRAMVPVWETAVLYHLVHAGVALAVGLHAVSAAGKWWRRACISWLLGIVLFSGSLYVLALGGPRALGPVTPLGGAAFLAGWVFVLLGALKTTPRPPSGA